MVSMDHATFMVPMDLLVHRLHMDDSFTHTSLKENKESDKLQENKRHAGRIYHLAITRKIMTRRPYLPNIHKHP